jgi:hypothetical protein
MGKPPKIPRWGPKLVPGEDLGNNYAHTWDSITWREGMALSFWRWVLKIAEGKVRRLFREKYGDVKCLNCHTWYSLACAEINYPGPIKDLPEECAEITICPKCDFRQKWFMGAMLPIAMGGELAKKIEMVPDEQYSFRRKVTTYT